MQAKRCQVYRDLPIARTTTWQRTSMTLFPVNVTITKRPRAGGEQCTLWVNNIPYCTDCVQVGSEPVLLLDTVTLIIPLSREQQSILSVISTDSTYSDFSNVTSHQGLNS